MNNKKLENSYVREYYDEYLKSNTGEYEQGRWHATPVREFEYGQTRRALEEALQGLYVSRALEIGPGDGVWSPLIKEHTESLHLVEQSEEMLMRAKKRLNNLQRVTFEHADVTSMQTTQVYDLVIAVRCFEYFEDKELALSKIAEVTRKGSKVIFVTKNPELFGMKKVRKRRLHTEQIGRSDMGCILKENGFVLESTYPAVLRLKAEYRIPRLVFGVLHLIMVRLKAPLVFAVFTQATESYVYIAKKIH